MTPTPAEPTILGRRRLLALGAATTAALAAPLPALAHAWTGARRLRFHHLHTGETLDAVYFDSGSYVRHALDAIDYVLRDFRTGEIELIDPNLLDLIHDLHLLVGSDRPYEIVSGYRSPKTNAMLAATNGGVAARSLHMYGKAIDLRLADVRLRDLRDAAVALEGGGVGYYPRSSFVHVDTGHVRSW